MVDTNQIVDIASAQGLDYDGRKLTPAESAVLESEYLKEGDLVTADLGKLKEAAELLEVIIQAKKKDSFDDDLYDKLNAARGKEFVKAFDKSGIYQSAIDHLINKRKGDDGKGDKSADDIDKLIDDKNTRISVIENRISKKERVKEELARENGQLQAKVQRAKKNAEELEDLKTLLLQKEITDGTRPLAAKGLTKLE